MKTKAATRRIVETAVGAAIGAAIAGPAGAVAGGLAGHSAAPRIASLGKRKRTAKRKVPGADAPMTYARPRHILVPVDFSPPSLSAVRFAREWAARFQADVCLLHVIEPMSTAMAFGAELATAPLFPPDYRKNIRTELEKLAKNRSARSVKISVQIREGVPHDEIVNAARRLKSDLVIIATHGRTGLIRALLGSTAERVVRHATCPVLTFRSPVTDDSRGARRESPR